MRDRHPDVLEVEYEVGVAESKKRVAAIFLLPVWPLQPSGRYFLPFSGPYDCRIADIRLEIFPVRKPNVTNLNLWTGSRIRKPEVVYKVLVKVRNDAEFTIIRNIRDKNHRGHTGSRFAKPEVVEKTANVTTSGSPGVTSSRIRRLRSRRVWSSGE